MDAAELRAWLRLLLVPGLGREGARRLLAAFGSPERAVNATADALAALAGPALPRALEQEPADLQQRVDDVQGWLAAGPSRHVITLGDPAYPARLLESPDPPLMLYVTGDPSCLGAPSMAVVGSRRPTAQGRDNARDFARSFGTAGYVVVSGLAMGIDAAAHEGALAAGARTVAVMGTGPDRVYPSRHLALARRIAEQGALLTEFVPGTAPLRENFPLRNRIIAGLSQGTLVVEAALQSGSLITARLANEAGREVFAIPGSIHSEQSRGCHALIRDGARLVESAAEVLEELRQPGFPGLATSWAARRAHAEPAAPPDPLLGALGHDPMSLDSLQARTGQGTAELLSRLLELELAGQVARLPGGLYQRRVNA